MDKAFDRTYERLNQKPLASPRVLSGNFWEEIRIFLAVAKWKSFNGAAQYLNVSQPVVSQRIARLEVELGVQLVERNKNGITLSEKGQRLADFAIQIDELIFLKTNEIRVNKGDPQGNVRIACSEGLTGVFIIDALPKFRSSNPRINLHLRNPVNLVGFRDNGADIVVCYGGTDYEDVTSQPGGFLHLIPMASKNYLERCGVPTLDNIAEHHFLDAGYYQSDNETWRPWRNLVAQGFAADICDNTINHARMIKAGIGIGLTGSHLLADSELIAVDLNVHVRLPLYLQVKSDRLQDIPVRLVFDWLRTIFNSSYPWFNEKLNSDFSTDQFAAIYRQYFEDQQPWRRPASS